jgi:hypothetical protein
MTRAWAGLGILTLAVGCVQINHGGYDVAVRTCPDRTPPPLLRSQVYLFFLDGANPLDEGVHRSLRDRLNAAGYAMVYSAKQADAEWYTREMHRLAIDQPAARFVLAGYGLSADMTREVANRCLGEGLPLDALVYLDPTDGRPAADEYTCRIPSWVVRSHNWPGGRAVTAHEAVELPGVGHLSLPAHPETVRLLARLMAASAARVVLPSPELLPGLPLTDRPQPIPRPPLPVVANPPPAATP